jgi:DNA-binding beta-propeller fold protein YncE
MLKFTFPSYRPAYFVTIRDRARISGLTSVRFLSNNVLVACDFNECRCYLVELGQGNSISLLDHHPTLIGNGHAVATDLLDIRDNQFVVTNFVQGSVSFYRVDGKKIVFLRELNLNQFKGAHGVRYVPKYSQLIWVSYCGKNNKCVQIIDYAADRVLWTIDTAEQAQDVAFTTDGKHALVVARTPHITEGKLAPDSQVPLKDMYATAYLYRMPENLRTAPPVLVDEWHGSGHIDATKEFGDYIFAANQYEDVVDVFTIRDEKIQLVQKIEGFYMPHGLDIRSDGLLATTNYGDQSLRLDFLPAHLQPGRTLS